VSLFLLRGRMRLCPQAAPGYKLVGVGRRAGKGWHDLPVAVVLTPLPWLFAAQPVVELGSGLGLRTLMGMSIAGEQPKTRFLGETVLVNQIQNINN